MTTLHISNDVLNDNPIIRKIAHAAFPNYRGRKFQIEYGVSEINFAGNYWDGGSRNYWAIVYLSNGVAQPLPTVNPLVNFRTQKARIPAGYVVVRHTIFCGKDLGLTFYVNQTDLLPLPPAPELSQEETIVLAVTAGYKSSYRQDAYRQAKLTPKQVEAAKASLYAKGLLNKAGAITPNGRNAIGNKRLSYDGTVK